MIIYKFDKFINENLSSELGSLISDENRDIKEELIQMVQKSVNSDDKNVFIEKIDSIIKDPKDSTIEGLIQDADIYEFYLKFRNDIDQILSDSEFFDKLQDFQKEYNCISLYDIVIKGTMEAVNVVVNQLKEDISSENVQ